MKSGNKIFYVCSFVVAFAVSIGIGAFVVSNQDGGRDYSFTSSIERKKPKDMQTSNESPSAEKEEIPPIPKQTGTLNAMDLSLGVLTVGDPASKAWKALGQPKSKETKETGETFCKYDIIEVVIRQERIVALVSYSSSVETPRNIHDGSTLQDVFNAYGTDYIESSYEGLTLYEYPITSQDGYSCYLRFAVRNTDQIVDYISVRTIY